MYMIHSLESKDVRWLYALRPTPEDLLALKDTITLPSFLIEELTVPLHRPKVATHDHYIYLVLHFPVYDQKERIVVSREIDFVIVKDALLTVHYDAIKPLEEISNRLMAEETREQYFGKSSHILLHHLVSELFNFSLNELDQIKKEIDEVEENIYRGKGREMVEAISRVKRNLINFGGAMKPQHVVLETLKEYGEHFFSTHANSASVFRDLLHQYHLIRNLLKIYNETLNALDRTNQSLITTHTNEIMKILTIMAFATFPLMLFTSLFGMNTKTLPIVGSPNDFWIIVGIMVFATAAMFSYFKNKGWI